jgi:hypothetical protein
MAIYRALTVSRRTAVALHRTSITGERAATNVRSSRLVCLAIRFTNWLLGRRHRPFGQATVDRGVIALAIAAIGGTGPRDDGRAPAHPVGNFASRTARRAVTLTPGGCENQPASASCRRLVRVDNLTNVRETSCSMVSTRPPRLVIGALSRCKTLRALGGRIAWGRERTSRGTEAPTSLFPGVIS